MMVRRPRWAKGHPRLPSAVIAICLLILLFAVVGQSTAQNLSIRDVPLKPWTGFAKNWDWTYDALHKLVISGIAGSVVLNTKPMSRREMAWILADIIRRIQENKVEQFEHRNDLQDIILDLMAEFSPELRAMGLTGPGITSEIPQTLEFKPIDHLQLIGGFASSSNSFPANTNGEEIYKGFNGRVTGDTWLEAGGVFAAYAQPELQVSSDTLRGQLVSGYVKGRAGPVELIVGRESQWWGPGFTGSMIISNNALPFPKIELRAANQFYLPWVFKDLLGPMKVSLFFGELTDERTFFPNSKVTGFRVDMAPTRWLEVGLSRSVVFDGGGGRPYLPWYEYPCVYFHGNQVGTEGDKCAGDNRFQLDASFRLADVGKYIWITRDAEFYFDLGWDDTCCGTWYFPIYPGGLIGLYFPNLFESPDTTFRFEFASTTRIQFTQSTWQDGYQYKGQTISHSVGTEGLELFFRLTHDLDKWLQVGLEYDYKKQGRVQYGYAFSTKQDINSFGVDVSYRHSDALSLQFASRFEWIKNRDFIQGQNNFNQVYTAAVTYTFGPTLGLGKRATLARNALPPVNLPPDEPDPDAIFSVAYLKKVGLDGITLLTSPIRWDAKDWLIAGGAVGATVGAMFLDNSIRTRVLNHQTSAGNTAANVVSNFGVFAPAAGTVANYIIGQVTKDERAKQRAADAIEATILSNGLIVYPMKFLLGRGRPDKTGPWYYDAFNISGSLPSFHTTQAFLAASVISEYWDNPWISALMYSLATGVGVSRIYQNQHWFSDAVASAAIGIAVGKAVVAMNKQRRDSNLSVVPLTAPGTWGAALQYRY